LTGSPRSYAAAASMSKRGRFSSSEAKDYVRSVMDRNVVKAFRDTHFPDTGLRYLGLPGPELLDLLAWREFVSVATAVEWGKTDILELNVLRNRLEGKVQVLRADIDELISSPQERARLRWWPYSLVNLDYVGGLVNMTDSRESKRIAAIRCLIEASQAEPFLLLLTLNLRDDDQGELDNLVEAEEEQLAALGLNGVAEVFAAHRGLGHAGLLKIYVPVFIMQLARRHQVVIHAPVLYRGTQQMLHFAFEFHPYDDLIAGRMTDWRETVSAINLSLLVLDHPGELGRLELGSIEAPA
jgi:hypothetical protein